MTSIRPLYLGLAWLFLIMVAVQFFLAGLGVMGGESIEAHRQVGFIVLHLIPILMFVVALAGKMGRRITGLTLLLFVLILIQPFFADPELDPLWIGAFHPLLALAIAFLGYHLAHSTTRDFRAAQAASTI